MPIIENRVTADAANTMTASTYIITLVMPRVLLSEVNTAVPLLFTRSVGSPTCG